MDLNGFVIPGYSGSVQDFDSLLAFLRTKDQGRFETVMKSLSTAQFPGTGTAYQPFNLDPTGKTLLPQLTPLQNMGAYAVKSGEAGDSYEYRAIVGKNSKKDSGFAPQMTSTVSGRGNTIDYTFLTRKKFRQKLAPEAAVTWELYKSSGPFNALGKTTVASLITAKELEERWVLGGSASLLGTPTGLVLTPSNTGGVLTNAASPYSAGVAALNYWGWWYWIADGLPATDLAQVPAGTQPTSTIPVVANATIGAGSTGSIAATVTPVKGAWGYLWIIRTGAGAYTIVAGTTVPSFTFTAVTGTATYTNIPTGDGSNTDANGNVNVIDGLYAQTVLDPDVPGEYFNLAGVAFTAVGSGCGEKNCESVFSNLYSKWKVSPDYGIMSGPTLRNLANVLISSNAPQYRILAEGNKSTDEIVAGIIITGLKNQYANTVVRIVVHPLVGDGKILFYTANIDYPDANVSRNLELHCTDHFLQDFFARTTDVAPPGPWAIKSYEAAALMWPRACGVITDALTT